VTAAKTPAAFVPAPGIEAILAAAKPREVAVRLCLAGDLAAEADRLTAELDRLGAYVPSSLSDTDPRTDLAAELDKVIEQMRAAEVEFRFRGLPPQDLSDVMTSHPARDSSESWNHITLPPHLVSASCVSPAMTLEQANDLFAAVNDQQRGQLFTAAWNANNATTQIPTSRAVSASLSSSGAR
jgi:hypothetical protein